MFICCFDAAKIAIFSINNETKREKCWSKRGKSSFSPFWLKYNAEKGCHACHVVTLCRPTLGFSHQHLVRQRFVWQRLSAGQFSHQLVVVGTRRVEVEVHAH